MGNIISWTSIRGRAHYDDDEFTISIWWGVDFFHLKSGFSPLLSFSFSFYFS